MRTTHRPHAERAPVMARLDRRSHPHHPGGTTPARTALRFVLHFAEMMVAMLVGMMLLGPLWTLAWPNLHDLPAAHAIVMATDMTLAMALWMRIRRHGWISIGEMSAAMYLPFLILLVPYWTGAMSGESLMTIGHVLMLPLMLVAMLWRRGEYSC